jgi:isopentenyl diphosphate isomerase/L-lactate dehydrogenase-like FMN-dependent dehydrogenase
LDNEIQNQYDNFFNTFATEGWKQLVEDLSDIYDGYRIEDIKDDIHLASVQGERRILNMILNFEDSIRRSYEDLQETDDD